MPVLSLGDYPFPSTPFQTVGGRYISDPGNQPATAADCTPYRCGQDPSNSLARMWCSFWGQVGSLSASDPACGGKGFASSQQTGPTVSYVAQSPLSPAAPTPAPILQNVGPQSIVQTPAGPVSLPTALVPNTDDGFTAARVHIPNIWDLLDPSKVSQFAYRGLSTSLPPWIVRGTASANVAADSAAQPSAASSLAPGTGLLNAPLAPSSSGDYSWLVLAGIAAVAWGFKDHPAVRRITRKVRGS